MITKITEHGIEQVLKNGARIRAKGLAFRIHQARNGWVTFTLSVVDGKGKDLATFGPINATESDHVVIARLDQLLKFIIS